MSDLYTTMRSFMDSITHLQMVAGRNDNGYDYFHLIPDRVHRYCSYKWYHAWPIRSRGSREVHQEY